MSNGKTKTSITLRYNPETDTYEVVRLVNATSPQIGSVVDVSVVSRFDEFVIERAF